MKINKATFIAILSACAVSYGVDIKSGGKYIGTHYFYSESETVTESVDGTVAAFPKPDYVKINYDMLDGETPVEVVVANGVNFESDSIMVDGKNGSLKFLGNNIVKASSLGTRYGGSIYATDATLSLKQLRITKDGRISMTGGSLTADYISLDDNAEAIFDGVNLNVGYIDKTGAVSSSDTSDVSLILTNGSRLTLEKTKYNMGNLCSNIRLENGSSLTLNDKINTNTDIFVGENSTLTVSGTLTTKQTLTVASTARVDATQCNFENLVLAFDEEITQDKMNGFNLEDIFGSETITASALDEFTVVGTNGEFTASFDQESGTIVVPSAPVPEPSTYAAIFGAIALGLAAKRRRK